MVIDGPEAVAQHLEEVVLPRLRRQISEFDEGEPYAVTRLIEAENLVQKRFGRDLLKVPYGGFQAFPRLRYGQYGYHHYFCAYALYPELMAEDFGLQADLAVLQNRRAARAIVEGNLPAVVRLDHDMADSRGTLVDIQTLDDIWFPHFARAVEPLLSAGIRLLWHCDGNLMAMVPRLLEAGIGGFQGFQYEDGMAYEDICNMKDRHGNPLMIWAGVSVTTTLPLGTPTQVRDQLRWLVRHGPSVGLVLGASSSITPGIPAENLATLVEGLAYYRDHR
jgi:uroporphyrinogen decarboxylase